VLIVLDLLRHGEIAELIRFRHIISYVMENMYDRNEVISQLGLPADLFNDEAASYVKSVTSCRVKGFHRIWVKETLFWGNRGNGAIVRGSQGSHVG
jgi:hypothetical protein